MENATKALIIAGAVLITILLISIGIAILRSSNGTEDNTQKVSNSMSVATFNAQFTSYIGNNLTSGQVKMLVSNIIANNQKRPEKQVQVSVIDMTFDGTTINRETNPQTLQKIFSLKDSLRYDVEVLDAIRAVATA